MVMRLRISQHAHMPIDKISGEVKMARIAVEELERIKSGPRNDALCKGR
jgi:hypothetical protein